MRIGSKKDVFYSEIPIKTAGGLLKKDLMKNSRGRIVSIRRSEASKKLNSERLKQYWFKKKDMNTPSEK